VQCALNQHCDPSTKSCVCNPGFVPNGPICTAVPTGDPATHTEQQVCDRWNQGRVISDASPWTGVAGSCDPGSLSQGGITDTLARLAMYRWLVGLGPVSDDAQLDQMSMLCAALTSWNPPASGYDPHKPTPGVKCYTPLGAQGAGQSVLGWGVGHPAQGIDAFIEDSGNLATMVHRRELFNPPLGPVGVGFYAGGGANKDGECVAVAGTAGGGPTPDWFAFPPPGFAPLPITKWVWTFHHKDGVANATIKVTRVSDSADMTVTVTALPVVTGHYGAVAFQPSGWSPEGGASYLVQVNGLAAGTVSYTVKAVVCP
jgi:hypothetical protein